VMVDVRQYASHTVLVSGLVGLPGTKIIQHEAVPVFALLAQAAVRPDADRALIMSPATGRKTMVDLENPSATEALVQSGDVVIVSARPPQFLYIGGDIQSPGEKRFHPGITLTQAILAAGGVSRSSAVNIKVARQTETGILNIIKYNLKEIMSGKTPDPRLEPGDRIEVSNQP
jgi:polysaccharide biosynthesis/export protein